MTENDNTTNPPPRKTLTAGKLSLNKPINLEINNTYSSVAKNNKGVKTNVAVEVKKHLSLSAKPSVDFANKSFSNLEVENRIKLLQDAANKEKQDMLLKHILKEELKNKAPLADTLTLPKDEVSKVTINIQEKEINSTTTHESDVIKDQNITSANDIITTKSNFVKNTETTNTARSEYSSNNNKVSRVHKIENTNSPKKLHPVTHAVSRPVKKPETTATNTYKASEQSTPSEAPKLFKPYKTLDKKSSQEDINKIKKQEDTPAKNKLEENRKLNKTHIYQMVNDADYASKERSLAAIKRAREKEKRKLLEQNKDRDKIYKEVILPDLISVSDLAGRMSERVADVIKELMKLGIIATSSQFIDADVAELIITTLGHSCKRVEQEDVESLIEFKTTSDQENLEKRPPVVTVMGHVDHGKTSLLDALKETDRAAHEAGGITQHIGAYQIHTGTNRAITFIDTPGHEAFSAMRARGAKSTDIVVLVVAADDGIKTQTIEAISHVKAANLPIIVAINKIDKVGADIEKVKQELLQHDIISEDFGGDVMMIPISATKKTNLVNLEDAILLLGEMLHLTANPNSAASGVIVEAQMHKNKGILCSLLVQNGTLRKGDFLVVGATHCKVKNIVNDKAMELEFAGPSMPIEVYGFNEMPNAGDRFVVTTERKAKAIAENYASALKEKRISQATKFGLNELMLQSGKNTKELLLIIKTDTQGSFEAISGSVSQIITDEVIIKIIHSGAGSITESDVHLAEISNARILGFNVKANPNAINAADKSKIKISYYNIIYKLLDDVKSIVSSMLSPIIREEFSGSAEVRQIFEISKIGNIAGSYVTKGVVKRNSKVKLIRNNAIIFEGTLKTLKRFKDDVKEARENFECGIAINNYDDLQIGDIIESFDIIEEKRTI